MKKIFFIITSIAFISAKAQTVDEVIDKYAKAMGGLENFKKVKTLKMTGVYEVSGMKIPIVSQTVNNKATRSDMTTMGMTASNAYKNGKGWSLDPFNKPATPITLGKADLKAMKDQCTVAPKLMDYKAQGHKVELLGNEKLEGIDSWKIKFTDKDDSTVTIYYISQKDNYVFWARQESPVNGKTIKTEVLYSDFKDINGLKFPMSRITHINGNVSDHTTFSKIELNVPVDEKIFDTPK